MAIQLKKVQDIVLELLVNKPETRNSDFVLFYQVCRENNPAVANISFFNAMNNHEVFGIPAYETVRRARQKFQAAYPGLAAVPDVEAQRDVNEREYREYARKVIV